MQPHKDSWKKFGYSLMWDRWSDKKDRTLINFLVDIPYGTMVFSSIDALVYVQMGEKIFELLDKYVQEVNPKNILQVITHSFLRYKDVGK